MSAADRHSCLPRGTKAALQLEPQLKPDGLRGAVVIGDAHFGAGTTFGAFLVHHHAAVLDERVAALAVMFPFGFDAQLGILARGLGEGGKRDAAARLEAVFEQALGVVQHVERLDGRMVAGEQEAAAPAGLQ